MTRQCVTLLMAAGAALWSFAAEADPYPTRPITIVVPFAAGGVLTAPASSWTPPAPRSGCPASPTPLHWTQRPRCAAQPPCGRRAPGTGTATYLGKYTEHATFQVDVRTGSATGTATFTAANGDTLTASVVGQGTSTGPTTRSIVEVYTITGGTGRFAGATGTLTLKRTLDLTTGVSTGTFSGAIDH